MVARALEWLDVQPEDAYWICSAVWATLHCHWRHKLQCGGSRRCSGAGGKRPAECGLNGLHNVTFYHENLEEDVTSSRGRKTASIKCCWTRREQVRRCYAANYKTGTYSYSLCIRNPATLARDSEALLKAGYTIRDWRCWICSHTRDIWNRWYFLAR